MGSMSTINELLAGSVGGAAQVLVGQPLDTIKTRAQIAPSQSYLISQCSLLTHKNLYRRNVCERALPKCDPGY